MAVVAIGSRVSRLNPFDRAAKSDCFLDWIVAAQAPIPNSRENKLSLNNRKDFSEEAQPEVPLEMDYLQTMGGCDATRMPYKRDREYTFGITTPMLCKKTCGESRVADLWSPSQLRERVVRV